MAQHTNVNPSPADSRRLEGLAWPLFAGCLLVGIVGLALSLGLSLFTEGGIRRFSYAYLVGFAFALSLGVGSLFFVMATHLFRAGWCVLVRRVPETLAASIPALAVLVLPLLLFAFAGNGIPYPWSDPALHADHHGEGHVGEHHEGDGHNHEHAPAQEGHTAAPLNDGAYGVQVFAAPEGPVHSEAAQDPGVGHTTPDLQLHGSQAAAEAAHDVMAGPDPTALAHLVHTRGPWLTPGFWTLRIVAYFVIWSFLGVWFWRVSVRQDLTGDPSLTRKREIAAAPGLIAFGIVLTFAAFDLLMSLDPTWFSTMFGIYYFAGTFQVTLASLILIIMFLQSRGFLVSVSKEHYHDLGKLMFAFVVFYAYVAFSQYMLIWYAAIPAEQPWLIIRGLSTNEGHGTQYTILALVLLFGRFVIPFLGLLSRHIKRKKATLAFWCVWLIVMHMVDMFWLVMPEYSGAVLHNARVIPVPLVEILAILGVTGLFLAVAVRIAARNSLVPIGDPRLGESVALVNI